MPLVTLKEDHLRHHLDGLGEGETLLDILTEIRGLKFNIAPGAAANTNIAVSGIATEDTLLSVLEFQPPTAASGSAISNDRTSVASITSAGNIQLTVATTGNQLLIIWYNKR